MKTSLRKLRGFALQKQEAREQPIHLRPLAQLDELAQASQDMQDMRDCYDSLLSAAAATANSAYEFSESLKEMGSCPLQKTALNEDEDGGKVLLMLGKLQFELHKLVDSYVIFHYVLIVTKSQFEFVFSNYFNLLQRSHILQTIAVPSESLLNELQTVEEMKNQCDEKRDVYDYMLERQKGKGRLRGGKEETFSVQEIQLARDEYDDESTLFVFRMKSLKQGQSRTMLTQAARHHAAQLSFFKKALSSVEAAEPHVKLVTEQQHIDYKFNELDYEGDGDNNDDDNDDDDDSSFMNDDGELSFGYGNNDRVPDISATRSSMELDQVEVTFPKISTVEALKDRLQNSFSFKRRAVSQSAPLFPENKFDPADKVRRLQPSLSRKSYSYVLPTPVEKKNPASTGAGNTVPETVQTRLSGRMQNLWHSSPLEPNKEKKMGFKQPPATAVINVQSVLRESNNNIASQGLPPPLAGHLLSTGQEPPSTFAYKNFNRQAFSGPLTSKRPSSKPLSVGPQQMFSGPLLRNPIPQPPSVSPPKASPNASPTFLSSPKISELHELPRPPAVSVSKPIRSLVGHSAPLAPRPQMQSSAIKLQLSPTASPLPTPPQIVPRSFSIPSRSPRVTGLYVSKSHEEPEDVTSPPLSPIALSNSDKNS